MREPRGLTWGLPLRSDSFQTLLLLALLEEVLQTVSAITKAGSSINLYMFHGGTNFGFINGAMHFNDYKADVTSYGKYPHWSSLFLPSVGLVLLMESPLETVSSSFRVFGYIMSREGIGFV